jgi:hypothetical protein
VAHIVDKIAGAFMLRALGSECDLAIGALLADVAQSRLESGPVLLLLWREPQVGFQARRAGVGLRNDLVRGELSTIRTVAAVGRAGRARKHAAGHQGGGRYEHKGLLHGVSFRE